MHSSPSQQRCCFTEPAGSCSELLRYLHSAHPANGASQERAPAAAAASDLPQADRVLFLFSVLHVLLEITSQRSAHHPQNREWEATVNSESLLDFVPQFRLKMQFQTPKSLFPLFSPRGVELSCPISDHRSSKHGIGPSKCGLKSLVSFTLKQTW